LKLRPSFSVKIVTMGSDSVVLDSGGIQMSINRSEIDAIDFGDAAAAGQPAAQPAAAPPAPAPQAAGALPAGTTLTVSLQQALSSNGSKAGQTFNGVLIGDVRVGDQVVIPSGAAVTGRVITADRARRGFRKTPGRLSIALTDVTINGRQVPIQTQTVNEQTQRKGGSLVRGAARGAALGAVGGAIGGDAGDGAAIGAGVGATSGFLSKGDDVNVPRGAVIAFSLSHETKL
ncbi:MAG: glycine zipper family protein, partial [Verrucomicrobiota bacterium]